MKSKKVFKWFLVLSLTFFGVFIASFALLYSTNFWGIKNNIDLALNGEDLTRKLITLENGFTISVGESVEYKNGTQKYLLYTTPRGVSSSELSYKNFKVDNNDFLIIRYRGPGGGSNGILSAYNYMVYKLEDQPMLVKFNSELGFSSCHDVILDNNTLSYYLPYGKTQDDLLGGGCYGLIRGLGSKEYGEKISINLSDIDSSQLYKLEVLEGTIKLAGEPAFPGIALEDESGNRTDIDNYTDFIGLEGEVKLYGINGFAKNVSEFYVLGLEKLNQL